jgi:large subunit ribosomal protein L6
MSKIGKKHIIVPADVKVAINGNKISMEGPKGKKELTLNTEALETKFENNKISVVLKNASDQNKVFWGLQRSLINNAIIGISKGYEIILNLNGVGFRANLKDKQIQFQLGFSHDILFDIPEGITVKIDKQTKITLNGNDKQLIGKVAADIKFLKPVEPYKQKGITSEGQFILKKEGKKK